MGQRVSHSAAAEEVQGASRFPTAHLKPSPRAEKPAAEGRPTILPRPRCAAAFPQDEAVITAGVLSPLWAPRRSLKVSATKEPGSAGHSEAAAASPEGAGPASRHCAAPGTHPSSEADPLGGAGVGIGSARRQLWRPPRGRCRGRRAGPRLFSTAGESSEWPTRACTFLTEWQGLRCHSELSASGRAEATAAPGSTARPGGPARCSSAPTLLTTFS